MDQDHRRITFDIPEAHHAAARAFAAKLDCSVAELARRAFATFLAAQASAPEHAVAQAGPALRAPDAAPVHPNQMKAGEPAYEGCAATSEPEAPPVTGSETAKSIAVAQYFGVATGNASAVEDGEFESILAGI